MSSSLSLPQYPDPETMPAKLVCPFCGFHSSVLYNMQLHIESIHTPDSPFIVEEEQAGMAELIEVEDSGYLMCTEENCGEPVFRQEFQTHLDMHLAERVALTDLEERPVSSSGSTPIERSRSLVHHRPQAATSSPTPTSWFRPKYPIPSTSGSSKSHSKQRKSSEEYSKSDHRKLKHKRLGTPELGPYAMEKRMPQDLYIKLAKGPRINYHLQFGPNGTLVKVATVANETPNLIPVISKLCEKDSSISHAWLCDEGVRHISKQLPKEGGLCGYRNIQMMISYIQATFTEGSHPFPGMIPSVIKLQDLIENGWDMGINPHGRVETGGIKGTRKYIGTPEADTLFACLGIPCGSKHLVKHEDKPAHEVLYDFIQKFYEAGRPHGNNDRILQTRRPPLYFQHAGHSMTIVGLELHQDGSRTLLVFDPSFSPSPGIRDLVGAKRIGSKANVHALLKLHRRGTAYLAKYKEYELLTVLPDTKQTRLVEGFNVRQHLKTRHR